MKKFVICYHDYDSNETGIFDSKVFNTHDEAYEYMFYHFITRLNEYTMTFLSNNLCIKFKDIDIRDNLIKLLHNEKDINVGDGWCCNSDECVVRDEYMCKIKYNISTISDNSEIRDDE